MPQHSTKRRGPHAATQMFDLVADVERYPEFVPLCRALKVRQRTSEPNGVEVLVADMTAAYKLISEKFTSRVTLDRPNLQILVEYFISYEFRSRMLALLMGSMFDLAFRRFAAAFEQRADLVYSG